MPNPTFQLNKTITYTIVSDGAIIPQADGSVKIPIVIKASDGVQYNGSFTLQADGVTWNDANGTAVASPPPALTALATATTNYMAKQAAAIAAPGVQSLLQALIP